MKKAGHVRNRLVPVRSERTFCFRLRIHCDIEAGVVGVRALSRLRRRGQQTRRRGGEWVFAGSSERGTMRAATHRCGRARARQTDFPPRNRSIPHRSFLNPLTLSFSHYFRLTIHSLFSSRLFVSLSVFLPRTPFHHLHPFSLLSHLLPLFVPRALSPSLSPSLFLTFSPHSVQYNVEACTERFAA